jgi:class 3 adenylate cyclase
MDTPSLKQLNRTFIGSVLFIDIVGYSKRTVPDQLLMKELFNTLLAEAVQKVAAAERIMVDTGDGAAIAFLGDPEDALFTALSLRDSVDAGRVTLGEPGFLRIGINLGPLKMVRDINGHANMIGDGVNDAQRVMSFAEPGQVMVSHSYYDIISRFSRDYAQLFVYEGTRHDKHVREHEVYRFGPVEDTEDLAEKLRDRSRARHGDVVNDAASASRPGGTQPRRKAGATISRIGWIGAAIGTILMLGAGWSWTGTPGTIPQSAAPVASEQASRTAQAESPGKVASVNEEQSAPSQKAAEPEAMPSEAAGPIKTIDKPAKSTGVPTASDAPSGTLKLAIQPWGEIYVDGGKRGFSPPLKALDLAPGRHRIEIRNGQFAPHRQIVDVKSGEELTVSYAF